MHQIGDIIHVRGDLVPGMKYGGVTMMQGMKSEAAIGQDGRIVRIDRNGEKKFYGVCFGGDPLPWTISEEMIERRVL